VSTPIPARTAQSDPERTGPAEPAGQTDNAGQPLDRPAGQAVPPRPKAVRTTAHERLRRLRRLRPDPVLLVPALITLVIGAWDLGTPSYWRDEAATLDAEARSVPELLRMLTNVDAVHGAYYLLMWPIVHTFGTAEVVLRLPSLLAMTAAAAAVAALGRRLHSHRAGLLAGLVFAVLPQVSRYAQEGRSYAFVLACAVMASYLLVRAVDEPGRRWLPGYGCAVAALGLLNVFGLLLLVGHVVFLLASHRTLLRRWLTVAALACLPALPVVVLAWQQRGQLGWLTGPDATTPGDLAVWLAGSTGSVMLVGVLIGLGLRSRTGAATAWLALPWLVAPPVLLLVAAEVAMPVYAERYVAYCLPALALPVGVGLAGIALASRVIALLLIAGLGLPTQLAQRQVDGHGDDIRVAADVLVQHERPGDGVLYDCPNCHYPDLPRQFAFGYPAAFRPLDDLALAQSPSASGTLRGTDTDQATLGRRLAGVSRVWLVGLFRNSVPFPLAGSGLHLAAVYPAGDITVALYER
jgi:mannosyltransferase